METIGTGIGILLILLIALICTAIPTLISIGITILTFTHIAKKHEERMQARIQRAIEDALHNHEYYKKKED